MNNLCALICMPLVAGIAGIVLGMFYFGGLWLTVRRLHTSNRPMLLLLTSSAIRMSLALTGFYLVMDGEWMRLLACLVGFFLARLVLTFRMPSTGPATE